MHFFHLQPSSRLLLNHLLKSVCRCQIDRRAASKMTSIPLDSPWDPNYPIAQNQNPASLTRQDILSMLSSGQKPGEDFMLIDLRREDHIVGHLSFQFNRTILIQTRAARSRDPSIYQRRLYTRLFQHCTAFSRMQGLSLWYGFVGHLNIADFGLLRGSTTIFNHEAMRR